MLIDGQIRNRLVSLADTVQEDSVDQAFHSVVQGAAARRKRDLTTRVAGAVAAVTVVVAGTALGWDWQSSKDESRIVPVDRIGPIEPDTDADPKESGRTKKTGRPGTQSRGAEGISARRSERARGGDGEKTTVQSPGAPLNAGSGPTEPDAGPVNEEHGDGGSAPLSYVKTHQESAEYRASYVSANPDRRSGCSLDGNNCRRFLNGTDDAFAAVSVADGAGTVSVKVTQWDRYGRTVGEALTYCGGESEVFALAPGIAHVLVSVEKGVCDGAETTPSGGEIDVTFFKRN